MELQQIRYFLALADELHFWNTAEKLYITQSALSRQIKHWRTNWACCYLYVPSEM
jgi:DNA-binding transcriptional LysR family regulator